MFKNIIFFLIKLFPPELSHLIVINLIKFYPFSKKKFSNNNSLKTNLFGYELSNPLGLAAGFDKNAEALSGLMKLNFSFIEVGTVTPLAQKGNKKPRVHRLLSENAIINSLGFPNKGVNRLVEKLSNIRKKHLLGNEPIIGVNIGCNRKSKNKINDYVLCLKKVYEFADYVTVNISSPNTPGLRNLQKKENLEKLLEKINLERQLLKKKFKRLLPLVIKVSPDIDLTLLKELVKLSIKYKLNGIIATNTTINKNVLSKHLSFIPEGGISGKPLQKKSNAILKKIRVLSKNNLQIIGLGGIDNGETAYEKLALGSAAIQIYSGLIFKGPELIENILSDLLKIIESNKKNDKQI